MTEYLRPVPFDVLQRHRPGSRLWRPERRAGQTGDGKTDLLAAVHVLRDKDAVVGADAQAPRSKRR